MTTGKLMYNFETDRLCIGGFDLHCGDVIEVETEPGLWVAKRVEADIDGGGNEFEIETKPGLWETTRVEADSNGDWYLFDLYSPGNIPLGINARI